MLLNLSPGGQGTAPPPPSISVQAMRRGADHYGLLTLARDGVELAAELTLAELVDVADAARRAATALTAAQSGGEVVSILQGRRP